MLGSECRRVFERVDALHQTLWEPLERHLVRHLPKYEIEEIGGDFGTILHERSVYGGRPRFYNRLYAIYRAGGYPCGWEGRYPEGRMVVYYRPIT